MSLDRRFTNPHEHPRYLGPAHQPLFHGDGLEGLQLPPGFAPGRLENRKQLLGALDSFGKWSRPMLLGASRKSFIGQVTGAAGAEDRLPGSLACACWATEHGANIVRAHDVAATRQAVRMAEAILAREK